MQDLESTKDSDNLSLIQAFESWADLAFNCYDCCTVQLILSEFKQLTRHRQFHKCLVGAADRPLLSAVGAIYDVEIVGDATLDPRFRTCTLVKSAPYVEGVCILPLKTSDSKILAQLVLGYQTTEKIKSVEPEKLYTFAQVITQSLQSLQLANGAKIEARTAGNTLQHLVDHQSSGVVVIDALGYVQLTNHRLFAILGLAPVDWQAAPALWTKIILCHATRVSDPETFQKYILGALANTGALRGEFLTNDGGVIEVESIPMKQNGARTGHLITLRDLSEIRRFENLVEHQRLQMIESQKLKALGEMASDMTHEINNPLAIIFGRASHLLELAQQGEVPRDRVAHYAQHILDVAQRVMKIVAGLRAFSSNGEVDPLRPELVSEVIESTLAFCHQRLKLAGIDLRLSLGAEPTMIQCRAVQVSQILLNLINNSVDAIEELSNRWIAVEVIPIFQEVLIAVSDSGPGIDNNVRDKIFRPFFTTKPSMKGTGLGLSISKSIAQAQGGDLQLDTSSTHTRFVLRLPSPHPTSVFASQEQSILK